MSARFIVSGTDTDIGKTVFSAMLVQALDGFYYKPVQAGVAEGTDRQTVQRLTSLHEDRFLAEAYTLTTPASPHLSAKIDGVDIDLEKLRPPIVDRPLVIEGAGGLLVPLSRQTLLIDVFKDWNAELILCARTTLGTINHTLLSIEALKRRNLSIRGVVFIGDENQESERIIIDMGEVSRLGRLPVISPLNCDALADAFQHNFRLSDFAARP